jgi:hypothetical protein
LDRGHSGFEVAMPPGARIDLDFAADNKRVRQSQTVKTKPDAGLIEAVRAGAAADRQQFGKTEKTSA